MNQISRLFGSYPLKRAAVGSWQRLMGFSTLSPRNKINNLEIRKCQTHNDFDQCVYLQQKIDQFTNSEIAPRRIFVDITSAGGAVFIAVDSHNKESPALGFVSCFPGFSPKTKSGVYLHVGLIGVHPNHIRHGIGKELMLEIKNYAILRNIDLVMWNYDPLDSILANIYINQLGGIGVQYKCNYYGQISSRMQINLPTDRIHVECWYKSSLIKHRSKLINELSSAGSNSIHEVHLPASINEWKRSGDPRAIKLLNDVGTRLTRAFEQNLAILDFALKPDGSGTYKLGRYPSQKILAEDDEGEQKQLS